MHGAPTGNETLMSASGHFVRQGRPLLTQTEVTIEEELGVQSNPDTRILYSLRKMRWELECIRIDQSQIFCHHVQGYSDGRLQTLLLWPWFEGTIRHNGEDHEQSRQQPGKRGSLHTQQSLNHPNSTEYLNKYPIISWSLRQPAEHVFSYNWKQKAAAKWDVNKEEKRGKKEVGTLECA